MNYVIYIYILQNMNHAIYIYNPVGCIYFYIIFYSYIYIYIERERDRDRGRDKCVYSFIDRCLRQGSVPGLGGERWRGSTNKS